MSTSAPLVSHTHARTHYWFIVIFVFPRSSRSGTGDEIIIKSISLVPGETAGLQLCMLETSASSFDGAVQRYDVFEVNDVPIGSCYVFTRTIILL